MNSGENSHTRRNRWGGINYARDRTNTETRSTPLSCCCHFWTRQGSSLGENPSGITAFILFCDLNSRKFRNIKEKLLMCCKKTMLFLSIQKCMKYLSILLKIIFWVIFYSRGANCLQSSHWNVGRCKVCKSTWMNRDTIGHTRYGL